MSVVLKDHVTRLYHISTTTVPMATKYGRLVNFDGKLLPVMLLHLLVMQSWEIIWQTKTIISLLPQYVWPQNVADGDCLLPIKYNDHIITWFCQIMWQSKNISPLPQCLWTQNLAAWLILTDFYLVSHDFITTWSCEITWQTKIILYPLTQYPWLSILAEWGYTRRHSLPWIHQILWSRCLARSCKIF